MRMHALHMPAGRRGFTLVELLVAITIFAILAALTLGAFRGVSKDDRVSAGVQQVKGWFEHARSMAIHDKAPRGIRLLPDQNNPRLCTSVAYIGATGFDEGRLTSPMTPNAKAIVLYENPANAASTVIMPYPGSATVADWQSFIQQTGALSDAALISGGLRIEIPRGSGMWYPIAWVGDRDRNGNGTLEAGYNPQGQLEDLNGDGDINTDFLVIDVKVHNRNQMLSIDPPPPPPVPVDYRLELGPTILPDEANPLVGSVVIDLDASVLPNIWRPGIPAGGTPPEPPVSYPGIMDIMFTPQGNFAGQIATSQGVMHLCVSTREDAEKARLNDATGDPGNTHPVNVTQSDMPIAFTLYPYILADPATAQRAVSVFLTSGRISSSDMNVFSSMTQSTDKTFQNARIGTASNFADAAAAYNRALRGQEAK